MTHRRTEENELYCDCLLSSSSLSLLTSSSLSSPVAIVVVVAKQIQNATKIIQSVQNSETVSERSSHFINSLTYAHIRVKYVEMAMLSSVTDNTVCLLGCDEIGDLELTTHIIVFLSTTEVVNIGEKCSQSNYTSGD